MSGLLMSHREKISCMQHFQTVLNEGGPASRSNPLLHDIPFLRKKDCPL